MPMTLPELLNTGPPELPVNRGVGLVIVSLVHNSPGRNNAATDGKIELLVQRCTHTIILCQPIASAGWINNRRHLYLRIASDTNGASR